MLRDYRAILRDHGPAAALIAIRADVHDPPPPLADRYPQPADPWLHSADTLVFPAVVMPARGPRTRDTAHRPGRRR